LPADFYSNYLKSIDQVTEADVTKAVNATIFPKQSRIFVAGKAADIADGLENWAILLNILTNMQILQANQRLNK
jgi:hypothetical protein